MVCERCEKKQSTLMVPDSWKKGAKNVKTGSKGRELNVNMAILKQPSKKIKRSQLKNCKKCNKKLLDPLHYYCPACSYKLGICSMCGRKILDTSMYAQSNN